MSSDLQLASWPFPKEATCSVYWITSPQIDKTSGAKFCNVFFRAGNDPVPHPLAVPWGLMPELWIGRCFRNGSPLPQNEPAAITISANMIKNSLIDTAAAQLPRSLYPMFQIPQICREYCMGFQYKNVHYIIPCIELARSLFMWNSLLANQLISTEGLEDCLVLSSWELSGKDLAFDFSPLCRDSINESFAKMIAILYGIPTFRQAWKQTALEFIKTARIQTTLPLEKGLSLQCHAIPGRRVTFLTAVVDITLPMPFRSITYGPAINRSANSDINSVYGKGASANKHSQNQTTTLIGAATETAKSTGGISVHRPGVLVPSFLGFQARMHRKSSRSINNGCGNKKARQTLESAPEQNKLFTPNDRTGLGKLFESRILPQQTPLIPPDPDFEDFFKALTQLSFYTDVTLTKVAYYDLPGEKDFCYLKNGKRRRYAVANLTVGGLCWEILELCVKDNYSISTLLIQTPNQESENSAHSFASRLVRGNGHWTRSCLQSALTCKLLDHYRNRRPNRWAALLYSKMA